MARSAPKPCRKAGCSKTTIKGYCDAHTHERWSQHQRGMSTTERGYGHGWRKLRDRVLERDKHLCQVCERNVATEVDHKVAKAHGGTDQPDNLQAICSACHRQKTAREAV